MNTLDCSALERAVAQLETSYSFLHSPLSDERPDLREQFRSATIQAFEYTYELAYKMIHRQLARIVATPAELPELAFMDLMRTAAEAGLLRAAPPFKVYREMRNLTSHTYNADRAEEVVAVVDDFLHDVRFLLEELRERNRETD